ncbi:MAG: hypothetical protein KDB26_02290 [Microthrixaceae bacterium]|nr:hypothetical protein [Microthrixaceae bacterium]
MLSRTRRWPALAAVAVLMAVIGASCTKNNEAFQAATFINDSRAARGIASLQFDNRLVDKAQAWADAMAAAGRVSHSSLADGVGSGWTRLSENVGVASSVAEAHRLFMESSSHKAAILNGSYTKFGTGVAFANGRYYVVHEFGA